MTTDTYRKALEQMWDDGKIVPEELVVLGTLQQQLGISADEVADIEREVMGMTKEQALVAGMGTNVPKPAPAQPMPVSPSGSFDTLSGGGTMAGSPPPAGGTGAVVAPGSILRGRYEVLSVLGRGGMGQVLKVRDLSLGEVRALKLLAPEHLGRADLLDRMKREVRLCQMLRHPGIVQVFDYDEDEASGTVFFTMEFMEGQTLREWLSSRSGQPASIEDADRIGRGLIAALEYAHGQKVVHLDLKPENVMVSADLSDIRILDFGISRAVDVQGLQTVFSGAGTPYYMAPEQERGGPDVGGPADIYALGAMMYELLVGAPPRGSFRAPVDVRSDVPQRLSEAVMAALMPDPAARPDVRELLVDEHPVASAPPAAGAARIGCVPDEDLYTATLREEREELLERQRPEDQQAWLAAAEAGEAYAQFLLARAFQAGIGPYEKDPAQAAEWYRKAADQAHNPSRYNLANEISEDQPEEAARLYGLAAHEGYAPAQCQLGVAYYNGTGVDQDHARAFKLFKSAFDQGEPLASFWVGICHYYGNGASEDDARAHELLMPWAQNGSDEAQVLIAHQFSAGLGVEEDKAEAVKWYRRAAEQDHPDALAEMGRAYALGEGIYEDEEKALDYSRRASELGSSEGMRLVALLTKDTDAEEARRLLQTAVDKGNVAAMVDLAHIVLAGSGTVVGDPERALTLFRDAADAGEESAVDWLNSHPGLTRRAWSKEKGATRDSEDYVDLDIGSLTILGCLFIGAVLAERGKVSFAMKGKLVGLLKTWTDDRRLAKKAVTLAAEIARETDSWPRNTDSRGFYSALAVLHGELSDVSHEALYGDLFVALRESFGDDCDDYLAYCQAVADGLGMGGPGVYELLV